MVAPRALEVWRAGIASARAGERITAIAALATEEAGKGDASGAVSLLVASAADPSAGVRMALAPALGRIGGHAALAALLALGEQDNNEDVKRAVEKGVKAFLDSPRTFVALVEGECDDRIRLRALEHLGKRHPAAALRLVLDLESEHASGGVTPRLRKLRGLRHEHTDLLVSRGCVSDLAVLLKDDAFHAVRDQALRALEARGGAEGIVDFLAGASREFPVARHIGLFALARAGRVEDLAMALGEQPDDAMRFWSEALSALVGQGDVGRLTDFLVSGRVEREAALDALKRTLVDTPKDLLQARLADIKGRVDSVTFEEVLDRLTRQRIEKAVDDPRATFAGTPLCSIEVPSGSNLLRVLGRGALLPPGHEEQLTGDLRFGREPSPDVDIVIPIDSVSRRHATISMRGPTEVWLVDHSTNGVLVGGTVLHRKSCLLFDSMLFEIGGVAFVACLPGTTRPLAYKPAWYPLINAAPAPVALAAARAMVHAADEVSRGACVAFAVELWLRIVTAVFAGEAELDDEIFERWPRGRPWTMGVWADASRFVGARVPASSRIHELARAFDADVAPLLPKAVAARNALAHQPAGAADDVHGSSMVLDSLLASLLAWSSTHGLELVRKARSKPVSIRFGGHEVAPRQTSLFLDENGLIVLTRHLASPGDRVSSDVFRSDAAYSRTMIVPDSA